jgi:hypothetical protein
MIERMEEIVPRTRPASPTPDILSLLELIWVRNGFYKLRRVSHKTANNRNVSIKEDNLTLIQLGG